MADTSLSENKTGLLIWQLSNFWQSRLRKILKKHQLTLNEFLILESIVRLNDYKKDLSQTHISSFSGIDNSVASVTFKLLEEKKLISRYNKNDNRKKIVKILDNGINLYNLINPSILNEEKDIFGKLQNENHNFINSIKLLLGKSLRIRAKNSP